MGQIDELFALAEKVGAEFFFLYRHHTTAPFWTVDARFKGQTPQIRHLEDKQEAIDFAFLAMGVDTKKAKGSYVAPVLKLEHDGTIGIDHSEVDDLI